MTDTNEIKVPANVLAKTRGKAKKKRHIINNWEEAVYAGMYSLITLEEFHHLMSVAAIAEVEAKKQGVIGVGLITVRDEVIKHTWNTVMMEEKQKDG